MSSYDAMNVAYQTADSFQSVGGFASAVAYLSRIGSIGVFLPLLLFWIATS